MIRRTTVAAEDDDLALLAREARDRRTSLAKLLGELVAEKAAQLRQGRHPRVATFRAEVGIAVEMEAEDPAARPFRDDR